MTINTLPARLTHQEAPEVARQLAASLGALVSSEKERDLAGTAKPWPIDASGLNQFDSSALAVLLECQRLAAAQGRTMQIVRAPAKLSQLARLYGLDELLAMSADVGDSNPDPDLRRSAQA